MRKRLYLTFISLILLLTGLIGIISYNYSRNMIIENTKENLKSELTLIEGFYLENNLKNIDLITKFLSNKSNKRITIIDNKGNVIGESNINKDEMENHLNRPEVLNALNNGEGFSIRKSNSSNTPMVYYAKKTFLYNNDYIIRVSIPLNSIKELENIYYRTFFLITFIGSLIIIVVLYYYIKKFTDPIINLTKTATIISLGDYDKRVDIVSRDEVGQLGHAFNLMAGRLQETILDLSDKKNNLLSILKSMEDGVLVIDNNGNIILANSSANSILNISGNMEGKHYRAVIRNAEIVGAISSSEDEDLEVNLDLLEKKVLKIKIRRVIDIDKNNILGLLVLLEDITRIKKFEGMRRDFVANVSHELKSPLTSIKGFAETLKSVDDKELREHFLDIINVEAERLTKLINDILLLSEIEDKNNLINFEKIDAALTIKEVIDLMSNFAKGKGIDINYEIEDCLFIKGDRDKLKQMLINLMDNGIKYTREGGFIKVSATKKDGIVEINIEDNGIGIPEGDKERIFERFYRVDKARSRKMGGTGLGLAIVKHIVILFKGEITFKSQEGVGTIFTIRFKRVE